MTTEVAERFGRVAAGFTERVAAVPAGAWANPAPCEGWVARDVVDHITSWMPGFLLATWGIDQPVLSADPAGAWAAVRDAIADGLGDPTVAGREADSPVGRKSFEAAIDMLCIPDVLVHTWDLARAAGLDEALDAAEVHHLLTGVESMDPAMDMAMRDSGHFGPQRRGPRRRRRADPAPRLHGPPGVVGPSTRRSPCADDVVNGRGAVPFRGWASRWRGSRRCRMR